MSRHHQLDSIDSAPATKYSVAKSIPRDCLFIIFLSQCAFSQSIHLRASFFFQSSASESFFASFFFRFPLVRQHLKEKVVAQFFMWWRRDPTWIVHMLAEFFFLLFLSLSSKQTLQRFVYSSQPQYIDFFYGHRIESRQ
jgi:hypothetical protein